LVFLVSLISLLSQVIFKLVSYLFLGLNFTKWVLSKFNDNELLLNESFISSITLLISSLNSEVLWFAIIILVSSANRSGYDGLAIIFRRSFIQSKKNKGPSTEPWGTPCFILPHSEKVVLHILEALLFIRTLWYHLRKILAMHWFCTWIHKIHILTVVYHDLWSKMLFLSYKIFHQLLIYH